MLTFRPDDGGGNGGGGGSDNPPSPSQPQPPAPDPSPPAPSQPTPGGGGSGAESRIRELNDKAKEAEKRAAAAEKKLQEREEADLGEKEKAEKERDRAVAKAEAAEAKANRLERRGWASSAAAQAGFVNPEDAVLRLDLDKLDSEEKITEEVKKLAEREDMKRYLAGGEPTPQPGFGHLGPSPRPSGEPPKDPETGEPDHKAGLGAELLTHLSDGRR